jgi:hypothetical protein
MLVTLSLHYTDALTAAGMLSGSKGGQFAPATASTTASSIPGSAPPGAGSIKGGGTRLEQTYNEQLWREVEMQVRARCCYSNHTSTDRSESN